MIVTTIPYLAQQVAPSANMEQAISFLEHLPGDPLPEGRIDITPRARDGTAAVHALVQSYATHVSSEWRFEGHRKYIDIQYILSGEEVIGWAQCEDVTVTQPYDLGKDAWLGTAASDKIMPIRLLPGQLAVFFPSDAHAPKHAAGAGGVVRKIVIKVGI